MTKDELLKLIDRAAKEGWKELNLRSNQLSQLPPEIGQLASLQSLYLRSNQLSRLPPEIGQLANLQSLSLISNQLSQLPPEIGQLANLQSLDLSDNPLSSLPPEIVQLANLQSLSLRSNQLSRLPPEIGQLVNLQSLDLRYNQLSRLPPEIIQLANLQSLYLSDNQLSRLPPEIFQLANLQRLYLSDNQLSSLPPEIGQLANLQSLYLSDNPLSRLPPEIVQLVNLQSLDLSDNQLSSLPPEIGQLANLQSLYLSDNQLSSLPPEIGRLSNLQSLDLRSNQLSSLPLEIGQLTNLQSLSLRSNQLSSLPPEIGQLANLQSLDLRSNQLSSLPSTIVQLANLQSLDLRSNSNLADPPPEIVQKGTREILNYFRQQLEQGQDYLYEAKFLIVGEGGAGKTSLAKKIESSGYDLDAQEATTEGIDVIRWDFVLAGGQTFRANIWDFGGQEIYHATHQFFLTKRSLYALVVDTRQDNTDLYYWLKVVELLSDNSPVLIIKNEKQDRTCEVNERALRGEFTNLVRVLPTNLATNRGLSDIVHAIQHAISHLAHVGTPLPKKWVDVRKRLETDERNYISLEEYFGICQANGFERRPDQLQLSDYLHDLGVCLHFQSDPVLKKVLILKPEWGTAAVYKALDTQQVRENLGRFSRAQLDQIWRDNEYTEMRDELLHLMMRFKLCYQIPGTEDQYIAPQLLAIDAPDYDWDDSDNLLLRYHYEFMPKGILTRFIVEMHRFIEQQQLVWKNGVVLNNGTARAEVIERYHKGEIHIRVSGNRKKDLLTVVSHELDQINASYERLQDKCKKLIPCNCKTCIGKPSPYFHPLDLLHRALDSRNYQVQCQSSFEMIDPRRLILDISDSLDRLETRPMSSQTPSPDNPPASLEDRTQGWQEQTLATKEIFISYAWKTESEDIANQIDRAFQAKGITIVRDKRDLGFKGLIKEFMQEIGRGKCVIAVIDDKYLKSPNCMFELMQVAENGNLYDRIFPVVLPSAKIYRASDRLRYIRHWQTETDTLNKELQEFGNAVNVSSIQAELNLYAGIRSTIDRLTDFLKNMNTLTVEMHQEAQFEDIIQAIEQKLND
ncbi:MAG: leucine-rich repeat domain-containing protein [Scytolyngbya sp. HA4215-MV1]|jgi:Leucine-rich repeat (LRR) protein|nr:leucine-rich repeat domain-containing protein [Scytolyngbya sp. HA4215-MV1]